MKNRLFILFFITFVLSCKSSNAQQSPRLNNYYVTSDLGYSGCKDEETLKIIIQASVNKDNVTFMKYHDNKDCIVIPGGIKVKVVDITFGGDIVELKNKGLNSTIWTVREVLIPF